VFKQIFADFHIHIGRSLGKPVKMAAAPTLTVERLLEHARVKKGLQLVTIIDAVCTNVLTELRAMEKSDLLEHLPGGGYATPGGLVVLLGSEVEVGGPRGGAAHFGCWFSSLDEAEDFNHWLQSVQRNVTLSSQRASVDAGILQYEVLSRKGIFIVHHAFTPHKGLYGNCVSQLDDMLDSSQIDALELGLSSDTNMADCISELQDVTFISNSDAHSLPKIAREYNQLQVTDITFEEVQKALRRKQERRVTTNYGLHPALGKYHRTYCVHCENLWPDKAIACQCGSKKFVLGVADRLMQIRNLDEPNSPSHRPPYIHQVPLEFVPGLGPKTMNKLLDAFGTEMNILHDATVSDLTTVVGETMSLRIDDARLGRIHIQSGGGGTYGKLLT